MKTEQKYLVHKLVKKIRRRQRGKQGIEVGHRQSQTLIIMIVCEPGTVVPGLGQGVGAVESEVEMSLHIPLFSHPLDCHGIRGSQEFPVTKPRQLQESN